MTGAEFWLLVSGSPEYDDRMSLRAALDKEFSILPSDVTLTVVRAGAEDNGASRIAGEWAREMAADGLPVREETATEKLAPAELDGGLLALRVGTQSKEAKKIAPWMIRYGIAFRLLVQGDARGLPKDVMGPSRNAGTFGMSRGRRGQGRPF